MNRNHRDKAKLLYPFQSNARSRSLTFILSVSCLVMHS
ncbi:hypothetical protein M2326_003586, partial [Flavobacterium sp. 7A]|nr:hypothetical protein [Flavobacterium sp. 7A]